MKVTITPKTLTVLPYLSTSWDQIDSMFVENPENILILNILLKNGTKVAIPHLPIDAVEKILLHHTKHLEEVKKERQNQRQEKTQSIGFGFPMQLDDEGALQAFGSAMQHNPDQKNAPDIPKEVLEKIAAVSKILEADKTELPKPEPHCNCIHCQIAKALQAEIFPDNPELFLEEEVLDEDLQFRTWDIEETEKNLYIVTNPLDDREKYTVFLGEPIGCTCGKNNCEHIQAVLKS